MFEEGGATNQLNQISEVLSDIVGDKVRVDASLNLDRFKQALEEAGINTLQTHGLNVYAQCQIM